VVFGNPLSNNTEANNFTGRCSGDDWECFRPAQLNLIHTVARHAAAGKGCWVFLTGNYGYSDIKVHLCHRELRAARESLWVWGRGWGEILAQSRIGGSGCLHEAKGRCTLAAFQTSITETDRIPSFLFGMQSWAFCSCWQWVSGLPY
jgi:hypothetical protein